MTFRQGATLSVVVLAANVLIPSVVAAASGDNQFAAVVQALDNQGSAHGDRIPLMWLASLAARGATLGGVKKLEVVEYHGFSMHGDHPPLHRVVEHALGDGWSLMVRDHRAQDGKESLVYIQNAAGQNSDQQSADGPTKMIVADLHGGELDLVGMELSPKALARWERLHQDGNNSLP